MGRDEWKTNSLPEIPAACGNKKEIRKLKKKKRKNYVMQIIKQKQN